MLKPVKKESVAPKQPSPIPKSTYWDLLCRNEEPNDTTMETPQNDINQFTEPELYPFNSIDQNVDPEEFDDIFGSYDVV